MPTVWTDKDERQFEHIKKNELKRGKSSERAAEIAGRTVNKTRRKQGRAPLKRLKARAAPYSRLESLTVEELRNLAAELEFEDRSKTNKTELIEAIREAR